MELADQPVTINMSVVVLMNGLEQTAILKMHVQVHNVQTQELVDQLETIFLNVHVCQNLLGSDVNIRTHVHQTHAGMGFADMIICLIINVAAMLVGLESSAIFVILVFQIRVRLVVFAEKLQLTPTCAHAQKVGWELIANF
jgi:hypothetical protein